ncbi:DUF739 family protein [Staphylococcus simiae]|uniref:DUF739 family protein n=1 Tax=Staphylococcus simiae TaxID=308354 RepID=UPI001A969234|nr:DUF739 family protein [Staphylococcus simiae]MBO1199089.1 DUF739 family protein [Staphylococcus simiae]MBO1201203.1 DUF739 family protein [Staphylococcus simiae]MBO1203352.1 DUF739 family protein [Staphylococcus simiae]MBO1210879.1 DUF739 family protein [Staphylococcus simiae]MBO1229527.1 DUF739 family protein [Staphylococcus simiae]
MLFNYDALNGKIVEKFRNQSQFALALGMSERSLSLKLNNKVGWKDRDIYKASKLLGINDIDIPRYFFNIKVQ